MSDTQYPQEQRCGHDRRSFNPSQFPESFAPTLPAALPDGWHLDKKVPMGLIFTILVQAGMVVWAIADIKKDVELLKQDAVGLHIRDSAQADSLRDAMKLMQDQFARLDSKLDRLIERGGK